jgi:hypothetical protein
LWILLFSFICIFLKWRELHARNFKKSQFPFIIWIQYNFLLWAHKFLIFLILCNQISLNKQTSLPCIRKQTNLIQKLKLKQTKWECFSWCDGLSNEQWRIVSSFQLKYFCFWGHQGNQPPSSCFYRIRKLHDED